MIEFLILLGVGYFVGQHYEKKHYTSIEERELKVQKLPVLAGDFKIKQTDVEVQLMMGNVVIASDYFKTFVSGLRSLIGGRMKNYENMIDRGRRESLLRLKEQAQAWGADKVVNLRIETSNINGTGQGLPSMEVICYGTAVRPIKHGV